MSVLLLAVACSSSSRNTNAQTARKLFAAFNDHNWQAMASLYAEDALFLDPAFGTKPVSKSRAEIVTKYRELQNTFPNLHDEVVNVYAEDQTVIVEFVSTGTASDGTTFSLPIVSVLTLENGLIIKDATYYDL